jgi:crotonobetainyl-CoA:carnitine CoA-transferase CaiB-like acyl-CoA transferase
MTGLFSGLSVLDLSTGVAGPIVTMMLADRGADVTRIESLEPDPFPALDRNRVWHRGKRSAVFDLTRAEDRELVHAMAARADIVVESFSPGKAAELGVDFATLTKLNPRLIYCSITGYGRGTRHEQRPAYDQLVAARTGLQWEARGWYGSPMDHVKGRDKVSVEVDVPDSIRIGADREGPIFTATPATSVLTAYDALLGVSAALRARDVTGRGQWVETSMLQAVIMMNCAGWQRPENSNIPGYSYDVQDRRQTWGIVKAADGYMCMWVSPPTWFAAAGAGETLQMPDPSMRNMRTAMMPIEQRIKLLSDTAPIFRKFKIDEWVRLAAEDGNVSCQPVRTPEQALCDPALIAEGSVIEVEDPELGVLRQAGAVYRLKDRPIKVRWSSPKRGAHTAEVRAEAAALQGKSPAPAKAETKCLDGGALSGIRVVDFGGAVAGPWATQLLADMGADVIKVDPPRQAFWMISNMALAVNRSKRWVGLDAKTPAGAEIAQRLVRGADVVMLNLRPQAAKKLGFDYETLSAINPRLVYCTTRGFEDGPRSMLPGNDQTGNALGGTEWEDGGCWNGGRPWFGATSNGDLGNGFLAAIGIVQALYDRERTGKGQLVDASILNSSLVNNSWVCTNRDGVSFDRPKLDADQTGFSALYRIYRCADQWLCIAVFSDKQWDALAKAMPAVSADARFATSALRTENDAALTALLRETFLKENAEAWFARLDQAGAPCEICSSTFSQTLFDDPEMIERNWVVHRKGNPNTGPIDMFGLPIDFSDTPSKAGGAPPVLWQHTREVMREIGYSDADIDALVASAAIILPAA